jgi:hypothetical protein
MQLLKIAKLKFILVGLCGGIIFAICVVNVGSQSSSSTSIAKPEVVPQLSEASDYDDGSDNGLGKNMICHRLVCIPNANQVNL